MSQESECILPCPHCGFQCQNIERHSSDLLTPSLDHLLRSNDPVSDSDRSGASLLISEVSSELSSLDSDIQHLQAHLDALKLRRDERSRYLEAHKTIVSPMRGLSPEVIMEIFRAASSPLLEISRSSLQPGVCPQWTFSQVCHSWRNIALSLPELWSSLYICSHALNWTHNAIVLETILSRSQQAPLELHVSFSKSRFDQGTLQILNILCLHAHRWQRIEFRGGFELYQSLSSIKGNLPILRGVHMYLEGTAPDNGSIDAFACAPKLQHLHLWNFPSRNLDLPWAQIRRVFLFGDERADSLRCMSQLKHLQMTAADSSSGLPCLLPHVVSLSYLSSNISWLILPALCNLSFNLTLDSLDQLVEMIDRSSCNIRKVFMTDWLGTTNITPLLERLQCVTHFSVNGPLAKSTLQSLTFTESSFLLPQLRSFELHIDHLNWDMFLMLSSRTKCNTFLAKTHPVPQAQCLKKVRINVCPAKVPAMHKKWPRIAVIITLFEMAGVRVEFHSAVS